MVLRCVALCGVIIILCGGILWYCCVSLLYCVALWCVCGIVWCGSPTYRKMADATVAGELEVVREFR